MAYVIQIDDSYELHLPVDDGEYVILAGCYLAGYVSECHFGIQYLVVMLYYTVDTDKGKDAAICVVCEQLSALCESHSVDAVGFEEPDGKVCPYRNHHKGEEQVVASCEFGNEEYAGERCVHDAAHQTAHAKHGEVVLAYLDAQDIIDIPHAREDETCNTSQKQ